MPEVSAQRRMGEGNRFKSATKGKTGPGIVPISEMGGILMGFLFRMKHKSILLKAAVLTTVILFLLLITACDYTHYPSEEGPAVWISEDPEFVIEYAYQDTTLSSGGTYSLIQDSSYIVRDGERMPVCIVFGRGHSFYIFPMPIDGRIDGDSKLLTGSWRFHDHRTIIKIEVETDELFDGQYETISFIRQGPKAADGS